MEIELTMNEPIRRIEMRPPMSRSQRGTMLIIALIVLVAMSLVISIRVDAFTLARRAHRGRKQLLNRADHRSRLVKFILGGVVIPIATLAAANLIELPNHQTAMSIAMRFVDVLSTSRSDTPDTPVRPVRPSE